MTQLEKLFLLYILWIVSSCYITNGLKDKHLEDSNHEPDGEASDEDVISPPKKTERLRPPSCGVKVKPCDPNAVFRRYDASCNNLQNPEWGLPNSTYGRLLPPRYSDGRKAPRKAVDLSPLPGARRLRTALFPVGDVDNTLWNVNIMIWGQFVAHDMSLLKNPDQSFTCCPKQGSFKKAGSKYCYPIKIPSDDPTQGQAGIRCMDFTRTMTDRDMGCSKKNQPAYQINTVTPYLDLSNVYGNDEYTANSLRAFTGGLMKVEERNNRTYPPTEPNKSVFCKCNLPNENACYATGDSRTNQNPHLVITQTIYVREHNRLAKALAELNPQWNDERIFQEARRINIAQHQRITYDEWFPILAKRANLLAAGVIFNTTDFVNDYNSSVRPDISAEHAHGAFRTLHTQVISLLNLMASNRSIISNTTLTMWINRPQILEIGNFIEQFTVGLVTQPIGETDAIFDERVSDYLLACRDEGFGIDLKATDIQRDRDHGLAYYNEYRQLSGRDAATSFDDYADLIPQDKIELMKEMYNSYEDVDLSVGGSLENVTKTGPQFGPTFMHILIDQFRRTRQSDRFWFENSASGLKLEQLTEIRKSTISRLFCDNADGITSIQPRGFNIIRGTNQLQSCDSLARVNLTKWKE